MEDDFQDSKSTVSLDQAQVRLYRAWKRHVTLAMAALAFLAVVAAIERAAHPAPILPEDPDQPPPADCGTIALTVPEAQRVPPARHAHPQPAAARHSRPDRPASELVRLASTPPSPSTLAPLPNPTRAHRMTPRQITIYDWSTNDCGAPQQPS